MAWRGALVAAVAASLLPGLAHAAEEGNTRNPEREYLFVHDARSGSLAPVAGDARRYRLTLRGVDRHALYFSDRPARETGVIPVPALLDALFRERMPAPNAAITLTNGREEADVLAVELSNPRYDAKRRTLRYDARRLRAASPGLRHLDDRLDRSLPRRFGPVALFIDDGTSFGNTCTAGLANRTEGPIEFASSSKWSTDTWDDEPKASYIPNDGTFRSAGSDHGGAFRGCSFSTSWTMPDGSTLEIQTTNPETGSNTFWCRPSNPARYSCAIDSSSVLHGPILYVNWVVTVNG